MTCSDVEDDDDNAPKESEGAKGTSQKEDEDAMDIDSRYNLDTYDDEEGE